MSDPFGRSGWTGAARWTSCVVSSGAGSCNPRLSDRIWIVEDLQLCLHVQWTCHGPIEVGVWNMADDASVVVGSRLLCLGNQEHPKLTLFLSCSCWFWRPTVPYEFGTEAVGDGDDVDDVIDDVDDVDDVHDDINVVFVLHSNMYFSQVSSWWQNDFWHHASGALDGMHHGKALRLLLRHRDSFAWAACSLLHVICPTQGRKSLSIVSNGKRPALAPRREFQNLRSASTAMEQCSLGLSSWVPSTGALVVPFANRSPDGHSLVQQLPRFRNWDSVTTVQ